MSLNYRETDDECPGCGSTHADRKRERPTETYLGLSECTYCGTEKCYLCDMGDDVECPSCDEAGP